MSYNSDLQSNNEDLQKILDRVNALPDIDSSGGVFLPDLGDTAAQPTDIAAGKVLYDDEGNPVTGNVSVYDTQVGWDVDPQEVGGKINLSYYTTKPYLFRAGVVMESELEKFGDAMPEHVAKGVKFTSKAGLLKSGEMEPGINPSGSLDITNNGTYNVTNYASAVVNVPSSGGNSGVTLPDLENEGDEGCLLEGTQLIAQDGTVVDGRIPRNTPDDITVDGSMVKVAPGYYENTSIRTVNTTSQATPSISLDEETGLITVTSNQSEGYVSSGTKTKTMSLDVLGRNEIMPGVADQTIDPGVYITGEQIIKGDSNLTAANIVKGVSIFGIEGSAGVEVEQATPSISIDSNGLIVASATQEEGYVAEGTKTSEMQLKTVSAQTINPGITDQKIEAGVYITGAQTIKGDANLKPENIKEGVSIYGLDGTYKATAESITVDSELKPDSTNPIQNKAVYDAINDINKSTNIATYTNPGQFNCAYTSTIAEVCNAIPNNSIFICDASKFTDTSWNLPSIYGMIVAFKQSNHRKILNFYGKSLEVGDYQMNFNDQSGEPTGVWIMGLSSVLHSSMYGPKLPGEDGKPYTHVKGRVFFLKASD